MKQAARNFVLTLCRWFGSDICDSITGEKLGRALLVPWRGRILVIGLETTVVVQFLPQARLTYWKQEIGFGRGPSAPDYPREDGF